MASTTISGPLTLGATTVTETEFGRLAGVTAGTTAASKAIVTDSASRVNLLRTTSAGTIQQGVTGDAGSSVILTKRVASLADNTNGTLATVSIPNGNHGAALFVQVMGVLGDYDSTQSASYTIAFSRISGANAKGVVATEAVAANTAGATANADVQVSLSAVSGAVGATNTFTVQVKVVRSAGTSANHIVVAQLVLLNAENSGVTIS